jgi:signal transduction histidine kinase/CheY-like chemotaxis protein
MTPSFRLARISSYGLAAVLAGAAIGLQWLIYPVVGARAPFLFVLLAIAFAAFRGGIRPALLVLGAGAANAALQFAPINSFAVSLAADRLVILIYSVVGLVLAYAGSEARAVYASAKSNELMLGETRQQLQRQVADLEQLRELDELCAALPDLGGQLACILNRLAEMHGTRKGLVSLYDTDTGQLRIAASLGFSSSSLERLQTVRGGEGACGIACLERRRVIVRDTEIDPCFAPFRDLARNENFRSVHSTPLLNQAGEILGAISVHFATEYQPSEREIRLADLCARKASAQIERAQASTLARETDQRLRSVLDASAVPFTILTPVKDAEGSIIDFAWSYMNAAAAKAMGHSAQELIGSEVSKALPGTWDKPGLFEHYLAVATGQEVREFDSYVEIAGVNHWFHVVAFPLGDAVAVWFADVSDRKRHELELQSADRRKDEFLAILAHELRNPLAPIRQAAVLAKKPSITESQKQWCLDVIERQVQHMSLLLEDLLDISRITRGVLQLRKQPTTLASIVEAAVETSRPVIESKRHTFTVELQDGATQLDVDPLRMSQVIANLLTNAAKYTNNGGVIRLSASLDRSTLCISVADDGIGIPQDELVSIFTMFSQVKSAQDRSEGGLGIGLALTKGLVELHGGEIEARSAGPGAGSVFTLAIPNVRLVADGVKMTDAEEVAPRLSRNILLADDNQDAAESLAVLLRADGHRVAVAHDGESAVSMFQRLDSDVVLLDIGMPRMSGYEVAKSIRASPTSNNVLLIAITGWGQSSDRARSAAAGFDHHMTKPVDFSELTKLLQPNAHRDRLTAS